MLLKSAESSVSDSEKCFDWHLETIVDGDLRELLRIPVDVGI
jgi:hypothetical protein